MTGTSTCFKDLRFDPSSVVAYAQTKLARVVCDLSLDVLTFGMS